MNRKLIAVAVAGVVAAPVAYADISAYGRINNRIVIADNDDTNMETSGSRFGFKGSSDLGNGMSAFARYEFGTTTDNASAGMTAEADDHKHGGVNKSGLNRRLAFVGMSGSFGSVSLGQQWSAYFQHLGTHASLNIINGPGQIGPFRTGNTVKYAHSFGPVSMALDARVDDAGDGGGNGVGGGVTLNPINNVTIAGAFDSIDDSNKDVMG
ncbi:MAG: porin, partial [Gammaproteobacteria bacterium]|nr:porin [Gammaproteobacteria bacterium]